jgi:hypothetical protein
MLKVFEVHLVPGGDAEGIIPAQTLKETQAQVMTVAEAKAVGFGGIPDTIDPATLRLVAVAARDAQWIARALEQSDAVKGFNVHDVG